MEIGTTQVEIGKNEYWWGGAAGLGPGMPWGAREVRCDLRGDNHGNQASPLLLSTRGRAVWSHEPFAFAFESGVLQIDGAAVVHENGGGLAGAFRAASSRYFPASGTMPPEIFFSAPQYNTWIELLYEQEQGRILDYARAILDNGFPPGVLMIDDGWQRDIGEWSFAPERFPDPAGLVGELHQLGFRVMLWIVPLVSPDSAVYRSLATAGALLAGAGGKPVVREWWNGQSAVLDLNGPAGCRWFQVELARLRSVFGVDGFKFDGGDCYLYREDDEPGLSPNERCRAYAQIGEGYPFNEFRACWKMGGRPLVQRQHDKLHSWGKDGLAALIPTCLAQGLIGHAFNCPDMIGGGDIKSFAGGSPLLDQELVVRYAQCAALMPMMQFSVAPWRILDGEHLAACRETVALRKKFTPEILGLASHAALTGEPIVRPLTYEFPEGGFEAVTDQFLLGRSILVAPVLEKGARSRSVRFPAGTWRDLNGRDYHGEAVVDAPIPHLPVFLLQ